MYICVTPFATLLSGIFLKVKLSGIIIWSKGNLLRDFYILILPLYSDERGVEAVLKYQYGDSTMSEKCFFLLSLLSESTGHLNSNLLLNAQWGNSL